MCILHYKQFVVDTCGNVLKNIVGETIEHAYTMKEWPQTTMNTCLLLSKTLAASGSIPRTPRYVDKLTLYDT